MNLQHLEYLIEIENCGSISKAARRLFVTQPYLSRILKEVESEYGITVFTREKTGITPTDSGRLFLDMARDLLDDAGNFQRIFRERADHYRLRVSACTCSHPNDAFIRMVKSIPDIPLRFSYRESSPRIVIGDVYSNRADVGVLMYLAHTRSQIEELLSFRHLEEHFLFSSRAQLFCREDHPILKEKDSLTMEKICQYNFALYPVEAGNARALESVYNNMDLNFINWNQIRQIVYVESRSALHTLLLRTDYLGVRILPILDQEKNYHIVSIPLPDSILSAEKGRSNYICSYIFPKGKELPKAARAYITFLEQCYGQNSDYIRQMPEAQKSMEEIRRLEEED